MADAKISALTLDSAPTYDDLLLTVDDPSGTSTNKKITLSALPGIFAPGYVSGNYYSHLQEGTQTTAAVSANTAYLMPIYVNKAVTAIELGFEVTTLTSGSGVMALYNITNGVPGARLTASTAYITDTTGAKAATISQILTPGWYCLGAVFTTAVPIRATGVTKGLTELGRPGSTYALTTFWTKSYTYDGSMPTSSQITSPTAQVGTTLPYLWWRP